tara:strand:- start:3070 stop:3900 length:831 start_codon:yes stop_codon:yes gene_type:complete
MLDKIIEKSPGKINLFLKIIGKRKDGYHNIRTGITFINLYDEIIVQRHNKFEVLYFGKFSPENNIFDDCIIKKLFSFLKIEPPKLQFIITKNFPFKAGLGSASSNVATVIKILENLELIKKRNIFDYVELGADIPFFLNQHDALIRGRGDLISNIFFPKYFFILIQPKFLCSTKVMYQSIDSLNLNYNTEFDLEEINDYDNGNDFEKILNKEEPEFVKLLNYLENVEGSIFTRLTGSGSCIFSVFETKKIADKAKLIINKDFPNLWIETAENNIIK